MDKDLKIYTAHPITGLSGQEVLDYYDNLKIQLPKFEILSPMTGKEYLRTDPCLKAHGYTKLSSNHAIFERDMWMVANSDIVLVDLSGAEKVSIGCVMELSLASHLRKHTLVVIAPENIHYHAFVIEAADIIFDTLEEAINYLGELCP